MAIGSEPLPIRWRCFKVMPLVYDESLSYYEVLCKLTYKINELIETLAEDEKDIYDYINAQDAIVLSNAKQYTNEEVTKLQAVVANNLVVLTNLINSKDNATRAWVTMQIQQLKDWIERQGCTVYVTNPITGLLDTVQGTFDSFYNEFNYWGLTALEYDQLNLTAEEYDNKNLTARQYDRYARKYLWKDNDLYMFHPVTGEVVFYKNVIDFLVALHRTEGVTATKYDDQNITAENYDLLNMTAYEYDWNAKHYFQIS